MPSRSRVNLSLDPALQRQSMASLHSIKSLRDFANSKKGETRSPVKLNKPKSRKALVDLVQVLDKQPFSNVLHTI
jgi:hypothetical protein